MKQLLILIPLIVLVYFAFCVFSANADQQSAEAAAYLATLAAQNFPIK